MIPLLKSNYKIDKLDFLFIDHIKEIYYSDLLLIENCGLLKSGSCVVADNVIVFSINKYLNHVKTSGKYDSQ